MKEERSTSPRGWTVQVESQCEHDHLRCKVHLSRSYIVCDLRGEQAGSPKSDGPLTPWRLRVNPRGYHPRGSTPSALTAPVTCHDISGLLAD